MQEEIGQVAARVRELRELSGLSQETMARALELEPATYLALEAGLEDISVGTLTRIARLCNVELVSLITGEEPRLHTYALTRKGTGVSVERKVEYEYMALATHFVHKKAEPFLVTVPPDVPKQFNIHPGQEFTYLLEGRAQVCIGEHEVVLEPGDSIYFDSGTPHAMIALDGAPARFLAVLS